MPATDRNPVPSGQEGSGAFWMATWNIVNKKGGEIETGSRWIGANGDRSGCTDRDEICQ